MTNSPTDMSSLEALRKSAFGELDAIKNLPDLETWRVRYLGRKSQLTAILRGLAALPIEERKAVGAAANELRVALEERLKEKTETLRLAQVTAAVGERPVDITLPGHPLPAGRLHPLTQTLYDVCDIFTALGFQIVEGPEVEWEYYNFEALNIPKEHPARDNMSTFWVDMPKDSEKPMLLRTHTSPMQVRYMEQHQPPIRIVVPGKVFRYEQANATHTPMFQQIEGLAVDKGITMAHLKGALFEFARRYFGEGRQIRFRCDYFPFVEPGAEVAIDCAVCHGAGCSLCKESGFIEILGAGMVHPRILERVGLDPNVYTGYAFGMGIERLPILRYGVDDMRDFYGSDLRFLRQF